MGLPLLRGGTHKESLNDAGKLHCEMLALEHLPLGAALMGYEITPSNGAGMYMLTVYADVEGKTTRFSRKARLAKDLFVIKKQTPEQRQAIRQVIKETYGEHSSVYKTVLFMDSTTRLVHKETREVYTCMEIQIKGVLMDNGVKRKYLSYASLSDYEVSN